MEGTTATKRRQRKTAAADGGARPTETFIKDAILLRKHRGTVVLDELLEADGLTTFAAKSKALNYPSTGGLWRAYDGGAVSSALIVAIRLRYPDISYERLFIEGRVLGERKVSADAPADLAA